MAKPWVLYNIGQVLTLRSAAQKQGRNVCLDDLSIIRHACIVISEGKIQWVGPEKHLPPQLCSTRTGEKYQRVDAEGKTVLPAFVECHTHTVFAGSRAEEFEKRNQGLSYQDIAEQGGGILSTVRQTRAASESELVALAQSRINGFVRQGVTTVEIKSGYGLRPRDEHKLLRVHKKIKKARVVSTYLGPHSVPPGMGSEEYLQEILEQELPFVARHGLATRADIFIENGYFSREQGAKYLARAKDLGLDLTIHADQLSLSGGCNLAVEVGAKSADHLVQIGTREIDLLAKSSVTAVLLPGADFYLKLDYPPARALVSAGVRVAIATDFNPGSCPSQSLSFIGVLARRYMAMTLPEVIVAYTLNAAYALGLENQLGSLEAGKWADLQIIEGSWQDLFYSIGPLRAEKVWRQGVRL